MADAARRDDRVERLISALEAQTNMMARLVQALDRRGKRADGTMRKRASVSSQHASDDVPDDIRADVERALRRFV